MILITVLSIRIPNSHITTKVKTNYANMHFIFYAPSMFTQTKTLLKSPYKMSLQTSHN